MIIYKDGVGERVTNKAEFARKHNLNYILLLKLLKGDAKVHKGWTLLKPLDNVDVTTLYDINGTKHSFSNKSAFAKEHGLSYNSLFKLLRGEVKTHKGWTLKPLSVGDTIIDVEGCERKIYNLQTFCDLYGLNAVNVRRILTGEIRSYKGWTKSN